MPVLEQEKKEVALSLSEEEQFRLKKMEQKKTEKSFEVAFCGHFSAGKSTILNHLLGAEVLPTSPIPTSANVIAIKNGELGLAVENNKEKKAWTGEIPWERVREWGMNGHEITGMTITAPLPFLGKYSTILDTPGVDSTDDSHQAVTVEQLYTTDVIVYCMDYNHVQSETNLYFLKQLSKEKKPIFIVINQIDKHNEKEIPISVFKQSAETVFKRWEINYLKLYFTSMKYPDHPLNQFPTFEKEIKGLLYNSESLLQISADRLEEGFYQAILSRLQEENQEAIEEIVEEMKELGYDRNELDQQAELKNKRNSLIHYDAELDKKYNDELGSLFKNVTLFPFTTTDLARNWIESVQPGFKVGLLFAKKKTEEEREKRLADLVRDLQDKVKSQLLFHLQNFFRKIDRTKLKNVDLFEQKVNELDYTVTASFLKEHVKTGYASRDYVFAFTGEITNLIVKDLRQKSLELIDIIKQEMKPYNDSELAKVDAELAKYEKIEQYVKKIDQINESYQAQIDQVKEELTRFKMANQLETLIREKMTMDYPKEVKNSFENIELPKESVIETDWDIEEEASEDTLFSEEDTLNWLQKIKAILQANQYKKLLGAERKSLIERIDRYEKQTYVISLFGAFSAGKSSFANALIGADVLPVSPNPTTATVNTVERSTEEHPHGTAVIYIKTEKDLNDEIQKVAEQLGEDVTIHTLDRWKPNFANYITSWQRTYGEYLQTIQSSLRETTWQLGTKITVSHEQLKELIAQEDKACLIEKANIFYDCEITKNGIILVDTPGVNSIHGRHTNVAFQQLRSSDAIFYLTYYNHAFSKADQYFLQQMAKVNESFGFNKLYFVINAADLAGSPQELNGVRKHVYDQLRMNGIEKPRLYHLSSKEGLQEKLKGSKKETMFSKFEDAFYRYTILELKTLSVSLIQSQLHDYLEKVNDSVVFMKENEESQKAKYELLKQQVETAKGQVQADSFTYVLRDILQEKDQLTLYLRERMTYVLQDYFATAINVAVLTSDNRKGLHSQLEGAINEWRGLGEYFLQQEIEATYIRLEQRMKERAGLWLHEQVVKLKENLPYLSCDEEVKIPSLSNNENSVQLKIDGKQYTSYLKSKKEFFEQGVVKQMKEALVKDGAEKSAQVIEEISNDLTKRIEQMLEEIEQQLKMRLTNSLDNEVIRFEAMFDKEEQNSIEQEQQQLQKLVV